MQESSESDSDGSEANELPPQQCLLGCRGKFREVSCFALPMEINRPSLLNHKTRFGLMPKQETTGMQKAWATRIRNGAARRAPASLSLTTTPERTGRVLLP